ncbi:hypothetical protein LTR53_003936 [Teratosphaeriaceae sp. CCFEE 6253]|nr:hypothetical protein LTR53_003936 [Teratosphaeriaceae sp. CCFEE 6253]
MSSMRNANQRRNHKERAQPEERKKWGLLEKPKDYKLRAADHNTKKRKLKSLQQKATDRNEDEFYFGMMSNTTEGGVKKAKRDEANSGGGGVALRHEAAVKRKRLDEGLYRTEVQCARRKRDKLELEVLVGEALRGGVVGNRVVFVGNDKPIKPVIMSDEDDAVDLEDSMSEDESDAAGEEAPKMAGQNKAALTARKRARHTLTVKKRQIVALRDQEDALMTSLLGVQAQRARMSGRAGGVTKDGVKFKKQRYMTVHDRHI